MPIFTHLRLRLTVCFLLAALVSSRVPAQSGAERAARAGQLVTLKGHRVLRLFGPDVRERGFAHGWLLAGDVRAGLEDALKNLPGLTPEKYQRELLPWAAKRFVWDREAKRELDGLFEGLRERLGKEGLYSKPLGRRLTRKDLYAINTIGDWFGPACSGFTVWGSLSAGGQVIHGRNLDFPLGRKAMARQVILAVQPLPGRDGRAGRQAWVGVGWPGLIGCYSAMNAAGFVCCLHDASNVVRGGAGEGFVPRGLLLRRMIETIDPARSDPAQAAAKMAAQRPAACGNLFHMSWPSQAAKKTGTRPAAVLEFDAQGRSPGHGGLPPVTIRRMDASGALVATNHYCVRRPPLACVRFDRITQGIRSLTKDGRKIGVREARKILIGGEHPTAITAHTLVFLPDTRTLYVALTRGNVMATRVAGKRYTIPELLKKAK